MSSPLTTFKPVPGFEAFYIVNKFGTVKALDRVISSYGKIINLKQISPKAKLTNGTLHVILQDEKFKNRKVNLTKIIKNLFGRQKPIVVKRAYKPRVCLVTKPINHNGAAGYSVEQVDNGEVIKVFESFASAAKAVGGEYRHISDCCYGKKKFYLGFQWKFHDKNLK